MHPEHMLYKMACFVENDEFNDLSSLKDEIAISSNCDCSSEDCLIICVDKECHVEPDFEQPSSKRPRTMTRSAKIFKNIFQFKD